MNKDKFKNLAAACACIVGLGLPVAGSVAWMAAIWSDYERTRDEGLSAIQNAEDILNEVRNNELFIETKNQDLATINLQYANNQISDDIRWIRLNYINTDYYVYDFAQEFFCELLIEYHNQTYLANKKSKEFEDLSISVGIQTAADIVALGSFGLFGAKKLIKKGNGFIKNYKKKEETNEDEGQELEASSKENS